MYISRKNYKYILILAGIYFVGFVFIFSRPLDAQTYQWADDALYFNNAKAISSFADGGWLGHWNSLVLSKAPFFSVFLAFAHIMGIPLRVAEFLLFAPLPLLFLYAVSPFQVRKWPVVYAATICLLCIPAAGFEERLLRTSLFGALALCCFISLFGIIVRSWTGKGRLWPWAVSAGLALGLASTTREEAVWLVLPTILCLIISLCMAWCSKVFWPFLLTIFLLFICCVLPATIFSGLNYFSYGVFSPSLRQNATFKEFYSILSSLEPSQSHRYVPITTETREHVYQVSPHFSRLKQYLEGPALDGIATNKVHHDLNNWNREDREFFVSNFEFALTKSIELSGQQTGQDFLDYCRKTTQEIREAVDRGEIEQGHLGFSMLPPIRISYVDEMISASFKSFLLLVKGEGQKRRIIIRDRPVSDVANNWHSFLMTWPYPSSESSLGLAKFKRNFLNNFIIAPFSMTYVFFLLLGIFAGITGFIKKHSYAPMIIATLLVAWSALIGFCFSMGIADTIAFPLLKWPNGYNRMGFFSVHFLVLISFFSFLITFDLGKIFSGRRRSNSEVD